MTDLQIAKEILQTQGFTCVLYKRGSMHTSMQRGVKPLVALLASGADFRDFSAADKVVGKATAFLYVLLGVKAVYSAVISKGALQVLQKAGIQAEYDTLVENIINRQGTGICPFEAAVAGIHDRDDAYRAIRRKMDELGISIEE